MTRLQKAATIIVLALCFAGAIGMEVWQASNAVHVAVNQDAAKNKQHATDAESPKESAEEAIARYNRWLTIFTAILAVATVGLGFATVGLYRVSQRQLRHAEIESRRGRAWRLKDEGRIIEQFEIARKNSDAAKESADAAVQQAKIAETALTQLERPYIFIFDVKEFGFDPETSEYFVEYSVANYGKMPAIIEGAYIGFEFSDRADPPSPTLMDDSHTLMTAPILQAGEKREKIREYVPTGLTTGDIEIDVTCADGPFGIIPVFDVPKGNDVFFRAIIEYRGPFSRGHRTGALWLANYPAAGQLAQRGGDDYNYVK